jgi:hypothetical protein
MWLTTLHLLELQKKAEPETVGGCATHGAIDSAVDDIAQDQEGDQPQIEAAGDEGGEEAHEPQLLSKALREASSTALEREGGCTGGEERVAGQWRDGRLGRGQRLAKLGLATYSHFLSASQTPASLSYRWPCHNHELHQRLYPRPQDHHQQQRRQWQHRRSQSRRLGASGASVGWSNSAAGDGHTGSVR